MLETILALTVLNTILILYMHRVIKNHHFYDGYPKDDWFHFGFIEVKIQKIMNIIDEISIEILLKKPIDSL